MATGFQRVIRRRLLEIANPAVAEGYARYFKHQVHFLGVRTPDLRRIAKGEMPRLDGRPIDAVIAEALQLLSSKWMEERQIGVLVLHKHRRALPGDIVRRLAPVVDAHVADWATSDAISGRVLRHVMAQDPRLIRDVVDWSKSPNTWRQRASAVAFLYFAHHGLHTDAVLEVCERVVLNPERFAQLGNGWVLRELFLSKPDAVLDFLARHQQHISREGLRYAIEKMPAPLQKQLLAAHAKRGTVEPSATPRARARRDSVPGKKRGSPPAAPAAPRRRPKPNPRQRRQSPG